LYHGKVYSKEFIFIIVAKLTITCNDLKPGMVLFLDINLREFESWYYGTCIP
jgi:hypothetical protein